MFRNKIKYISISKKKICIYIRKKRKYVYISKRKTKQIKLTNPYFNNFNE